MWIYSRPNEWPMPREVLVEPTFVRYAEGGPSTGTLSSLPAEIFQEILLHLPLDAVLSFSGSSKHYRNLITEKTFLSDLLRRMVAGGNLNWIYPVSGEDGTALEAWLPDSKDGDGTQARLEDPLKGKDFPFLSFVYACHVKSDSMRNRRRLWTIVAQFRRIFWKNEV
ncbi:hypothetical protein DL96DRAFT_1613276 [Flagelloscypha sp. PMI_526]|nr:hypothetical protein DL96DRAFT_1613276 [Flagelloscypha sp. PMI_526]